MIVTRGYYPLFLTRTAVGSKRRHNLPCTLGWKGNPLFLTTTNHAWLLVNHDLFDACRNSRRERWGLLMVVAYLICYAQLAMADGIHNECGVSVPTT